MNGRDGPDFLCIGAQKAGTRWLYDQVVQHEDFWMPPIKELHFFDARPSGQRKAEKLYRSASRDLEETNRRRRAAKKRPIDQRDMAFLASYLAVAQDRGVSFAAGLRWRACFDAYGKLFSHAGSALTGDITPGYSTLYPKRVARVMKTFPDVKVVFIARDPVERLWSALAMRKRKGRIRQPLTEKTVPRLWRGHLCRRSLQTQIVARWRRFVPESQFGLFLFDDLVADATAFRLRILTFLGADPDKASGSLPAGFNRKANHRSAVLTDSMREVLTRLLEDELKASAREFGGAAARWPARYGL